MRAPAHDILPTVQFPSLSRGGWSAASGFAAVAGRAFARGLVIRSSTSWARKRFGHGLWVLLSWTTAAPFNDASSSGDVTRPPSARKPPGGALTFSFSTFSFGRRGYPVPLAGSQLRRVLRPMLLHTPERSCSATTSAMGTTVTNPSGCLTWRLFAVGAEGRQQLGGVGQLQRAL